MSDLKIKFIRYFINPVSDEEPEYFKLSWLRLFIVYLKKKRHHYYHNDFLRFGKFVIILIVLFITVFFFLKHLSDQKNIEKVLYQQQINRNNAIEK
jgi:hypothetical protein